MCFICDMDEATEKVANGLRTTFSQEVRIAMLLLESRQLRAMASVNFFCSLVEEIAKDSNHRVLDKATLELFTKEREAFFGSVDGMPLTQEQRAKLIEKAIDRNAESINNIVENAAIKASKFDKKHKEKAEAAVAAMFGHFQKSKH